MDLDSTAATRLAALSARADQADLATAVRDLVRSTLIAVPTCLALRISTGGAGTITVSAPEFEAGAVPARASLRLEIAPAGAGTSSHQVVFLASEPLAFHDFQTVPSSARGERIVVDDDLGAGEGAATPAHRALDWLEDQSQIDRAIGMLMNDGQTAGGAQQQLSAGAAWSGRSLSQQARHLLGEPGSG